MASVRGRSSPSSRTTVDLRTTAWMTADRTNPRISAQVICQVIDPVMDRAWIIACTTFPLSSGRPSHHTPMGYVPWRGPHRARRLEQPLGRPEHTDRTGAYAMRNLWVAHLP